MDAHEFFYWVPYTEASVYLTFSFAYRVMEQNVRMHYRMNEAFRTSPQI